MLDRVTKLVEAHHAAGLARRVGAGWDYLAFVTRRLWPLGVGFAGVLVAVLTLLPSAWSLGLSALALVLGVTVFVWDVRQARRQWSTYKWLEVAEPFPEDIPPPLGYEGAVYLRVPNRGTMLVHRDADRVLQAGPVPVMADETPYQLPVELRDLAPIALHAVRAGKVIFNDIHLGLRDDLLPASSSESRPLRLVETSYFDHVCSAELCQYTVIDQVTNAETEIRRIELIDPGGRLVTLAASRVANIIGVSTLAFTSDDLLLMVPQSKNNVASQRLYAPSGSGSLDPADWQAAGDGACLQDILIRGVERELCEETGISPDDVGQTQVVGFGRWLERGAKPEFFAVTRLKIRASDVKAAKVSAAEKIYSDRVRPVFVDLDRLEGELADGQPIHRAQSCPPDIRRTGSLPLIAGLQAVALSGQLRSAGRS